ncbi:MULTISPECIES: carboxymuconolactone decarboxylase family protein [unclassified Inquilinus]|uniref:carboxymuconolactone decarboxylase family protein n=1 Tax=unclassified Inquilinus TaxID=2645927 RepID=UPI003F91173B
MFVKTIGEDEAKGWVAESYAADRSRLGFVMSATACWTARPDLLPAWEDFYTKVKAGFSLSSRDWRLITFIAARHVPSTYCSMVYGKMLVDDLGSKDRVLAVQADFRTAGLCERDVAMLAYAEAIARNASQVTGLDVDALRAVGFRDVQIADIALCASLRCFMARFFDATGAEPEPAFIDQDSDFSDALTVGRKPRHVS